MNLQAFDNAAPSHIIQAALDAALPPEDGLWRPTSADGEGPNRIGRHGPTYFHLPPKHFAIDWLSYFLHAEFGPVYRDAESDFTYAGVFQMLPGAMISPHRDRNTIPQNPHYRRRLAAVLFLNESEGGNFELWDRTGLRIAIPPAPGRLIVFDINEYHAVSPVEGNERRLTLAMHLASKLKTTDNPIGHERQTWLADDHPEAFE